jgi:sigma-B regulation protein RsbU (phosphoserine phosphatase)
MRPATEVGGDYYDIVPLDDGAWFGMGDVAGHGLESGLVMLMIQSSVLALVRDNPTATPSDLIVAINRALYHNLRDRLRVKSFATFALFRYRVDGTFVHAGRHEEIVVWRAATRTCEILSTSGPWIGGMANIRTVTTESSFRLEHGDVMVLFTDGVIEAHNAERKELGLDRVRDLVQSNCDEPVDRIRERILDAVVSWERTIEDDASLVVVRRREAA